MPMGAAAGTVRGDETAGHIARVAARLFATRGYDATSVREIVEAAGTTKPSLYYHFGSKEGLAEAIVSTPIEALIGRMRGVVAESPGTTRGLRRLAEIHFEFAREDPDRTRFLLGVCFGPMGTGLASSGIGAFGERMCRLGAELKGVERAAVVSLAGAGVVDPGRVDRCARAFHGLVFAHLLQFLFDGTPIGPGDADRLVADLLDGFGAAGAAGGHA